MSRSRAWVFTLNNPEDPQIPTTWKESGAVYGVWQLEAGASGTPHLQGYVVFKNQKSLGAVKTINPQAHWEPRMGTHQQAKSYCEKEEGRLAGPWTYGVEPHQGQGKRSDLDQLKESIDSGATLLECAEMHFGTMAKFSRWAKEYTILKGLNKRNWLTYTTVVWGPTGTGKTRSVQDRAGPKAYWMKKPGAGQSVFFDGYDGEEDVVIDEFYGWIPYDLLLRMCDRYPLLVDTKGGAVQFCPKRIWITSNVEPRQWYPRAWTPAMERRLAEPLGTVEYLGPSPYEKEIVAAQENLDQVVVEYHAGEKRPVDADQLKCPVRSEGCQRWHPNPDYWCCVCSGRPRNWWKLGREVPEDVMEIDTQEN